MTVKLDPETTRFIADQVEVMNKTPAEIINDLIREKFAVGA